MIEKTYETVSGVIHYWTSDTIDKARRTLVFFAGTDGRPQAI